MDYQAGACEPEARHCFATVTFADRFEPFFCCRKAICTVQDFPYNAGLVRSALCLLATLRRIVGFVYRFWLPFHWRSWLNKIVLAVE